jgi:phosphotransferase system  glucose/maltose/N-acetylglucosamine-specific IIC component
VNVRDTARRYLGAASLAAGLVGILEPELPARLTGAEIDEARGLGFRDLAIGLAIYASPRVGLAHRALVDLGDALTFAKRRPPVAAVALGSAALAVYAATRS